MYRCCTVDALVHSYHCLLLLLLLLLQELVGIMAASKGLVLMAPPSGNTEAQKTLAALLSAIKPKTKVGCVPAVQLHAGDILGLIARTSAASVDADCQAASSHSLQVVLPPF
jgi:hypothetical protein